MFTFSNPTTSLVNILPNNTKHFFAFVHYSNSTAPLQLQSSQSVSSATSSKQSNFTAKDAGNPRAASSTMTAFKPLTFTPVEFSLTDGTQIPAPAPDSPPLTPTKSGLPSLEEENSDEENQNPKTSNSRHINVGTPNSKLNAAPLSPLSATSVGSQPKRHGIRKFLSLRSLRGESRRQRGETAADGSSIQYTSHSSRPGSPYTTDTAMSSEASHSRKNAGWFGSVSGRRKSQMYVIGRLDERLANSTSPEQNKPKGPPPPAIPEFSLGNELEMGGDDLFKNIK